MNKLKKRTQNVLTAILMMMVVPIGLTLLLNGKMNEIYQNIKNDITYITIRHGAEVKDIDLEEYVMGITAVQIPLEYDLEAIKAQMVIARTNAYREMQDGKIEGEGMSLVELELRGAGDKFRKAQKATRGLILTQEGEPILASFHAVSSGKTRDGQETFQSEKYAYLKSRNCPADKNAPDYKMTVQIDDSWKDLTILERDSAGYVRRVQKDNETMSGEEFRLTLGLMSSNFRMETNGSGTFVTTYGVGHGLGMSQYTAQQMASSGKNYKEILAYFYEGVEVSKID